MTTTLDINIFKVINAGHFWANPVAQPDFMGKLNDHFRSNTTSEVINPLHKGQMCVVRRTSDKCWYRARVQNVLQTLSGPQASVFLVDLAESTLIPCCWIREVPVEFQNIPFQAMECFLTGLKPLGLVTAYFDLTTSKQETDHWDEAANSLFKTLIQGSKLQVSIQKQDDKGRYHVLLMADSGQARVCINDELVITGFAAYFSDTVQNSDMRPGKAAKIQAINDKFQKQGSEVIRNLKEYISHGKFTSSEQSNSTDDEEVDHTRTNHRFLDSGESPLNVLRRHLSGSYGPENGTLSMPSARIPKGASQMVPSQRFSPETSIVQNASGGALREESVYRRADALSSDENSGRVRFLSSRLPATGSSNNRGYSSIPSKSPDSSTLKPILKKRSPHGTAHQSSGSSSEPEDSFQRKRLQLDKEDSGYSCSEIPELASCGSSSDISLMGQKKTEPTSSNAISVGTLFGSRSEASHYVLENTSFAQRSEASVPLTQGNVEPYKGERSPQRVLSLVESLRNDSSARSARACEPPAALSGTSVQPFTQGSIPAGYEDYMYTMQSSINKEQQTFANKTSLNTHFPPSSTSSVKSPLPSEMLISSQSPSSPLHPTSGRKITFSDGALIQTEGAPAPRPMFSLENLPFSHYLRQLGITSPSLIQAHVWPALTRGRDVVGICTEQETLALAYLVPIINQLVEERGMYADLPSGSGPKLLILVPTWIRGDQIYCHCKQMLSRNRTIRVQLMFAGGTEESHVIQLVNGCEILIATPPCFHRMLRKGYVNLNRLCHTVFNDADLMVEDFTSEIKDIMRHYAKLLKSQPSRSAPRQAVVMATSWSVGVASLVKAYLGNPVLIMSDMIEAAIYRGVQQVVTVCYDSERHVPLLGYIESLISTKDICIFASTASEAENIGEILKASCYFTLVAHEFLEPQELASVKRQWNTPHSSDAMPVLVMTDAVIDQMNITNASCLIHYNYPGSKTKLRRRLTTLAGTFTSSEEHGCISVIFVTDKCKPEFPANVAQLVRRSGQEVPKSLKDVVDAVATQGINSNKELCDSLKAFGTCRWKRENRNCNKYRHTVSAELDRPRKGIPTSGIVKVMILSVETVSCYWVRILEHRPADAHQKGSACSRTVDTTEFLELTMSVSGWYADPLNRVKHELVSVGDLCAVMSGNSFQRVKVCRVLHRDNHSNKPVYVEIQYVDRGAFEEDVHVDRLLQLPPQFHSCPFQAVEVFACRLQPLDKDTAWTVQGKIFVKHLIEGKEMEGRVVLSLGNTMWLDPLVERRHLKSINVTTNLLNIRMELLKEKLAAENKQHVRLLRSLCEGVIDLSPLEGGASGLAENSDKRCPALDTAVLPGEGYHSVYVSAVENPDLFFIQLKSSEDSLEDLRQKINSGVGKVDVEESKISIGSFCVAKFSEDDRWYRARVMGSRPDNEYDVFYVDFGDREWVTADRIVPAWSSILQLPLQAIECSLVNIQPLENDWSAESSDAFWEMVNDQLLVAKVKSTSASLVTGSHRFVIELYDTTTEHDVIISHEMVATGHAQTSPEGTKILFPYATDQQEEYDFAYQKILEMCLEAHQCRDSARKVEVVKEIQSFVLNSESSKDDIRVCGGIQALCRLLSLNRNPLVLQHILASLASLAFENESNCDEVRNQGGLQTMCYLLGKMEDNAVQESLAWALKNLAATERNQNEVRKCGGIKALCGLLKSASERVQERVAWALGSLVKDHTSNCQAVQEWGGLKTLCELIAETNSENVLERAIWALGMLAVDVKNRNFIRQYGGIENICKKLQQSPSEQIIKQSALTLKTLASNNQYNKDVMSRLGLIGTLRSFMTEEPQRLGIISRRVCWDLLQRLLGSAAGVLPPTSPQAPIPTRTQASATRPDRATKQEPETKLVNGLGVGDDDEDLPPLGGDEESDKENDRTLAAKAASTSNASAKPAPRQTSSVQVAQRNSVTSARERLQARPSTAEEENFVPFRVHPKTVWSQTKDLVCVCVKLRGVERQQTEITDSRLKFRTQMGRSLYELDLELFEDIDAQHRDSGVKVKGAEVQILLKKRNHAVWTRLLKSREKLPYVSIDFDRWEVWSSSEEDEEDEGARAAPTIPNNSRRQAEDKEESKQVLLPEMLVSDSSSSDGEESLASDVDCFNFN